MRRAGLDVLEAVTPARARSADGVEVTDEFYTMIVLEEERDRFELVPGN